MGASRRLLLLVNLGTPDEPTPEAVRKFLPRHPSTAGERRGP